MTHEPFIEETYRLAREAVSRGDHPFGALLVRDGEILLRAHNSVHSSHDITGHAELNLVRLATGRFSARELEHCTLYTSTEPCLMCCGGIYWANIRQVVFGVSSAALAALSGGNFVIPSPSLFAR
ncbi:MAG: nucleoside deaminase, partial [Anaerolineales bacterium]|nr:nucleoside deaminase [Anaerolineales bacterium]